jgi:hypothetical protein
MNRYTTPTPRAAFAVAAFALTALTTSLAVIVPAHVAPAAAPTEVAIVPSRIEVIAVRNKALATAPDANLVCNDQST